MRNENDFMNPKIPTAPVLDNQFDYKGYRCYVARHPNGQLLGYIRTEGKMSREQVEDLEVHGGVTFVDSLEHIGKPEEYAIGFDCGHAFDYIPRYQDMGGHFWSGLEVIEEIKKLVDQLIYSQLTEEGREQVKSQEDYYQEIVEHALGNGVINYVEFLKDCALTPAESTNEHLARVEFIRNWHHTYLDDINVF